MTSLRPDSSRAVAIAAAVGKTTPLATQITVRPEASNDSEQLTRVLNLLHKRFAEPIRVEDLCSVGNLSPRSLHRLFLHHVGENVSDYLGRLRIGRACMWLVETDRPISVIAADAGFSNLSNFNRRFRATRHMTPKEFRRYYLKHGRMPELDRVDLTKRPPSLERQRQPKARPRVTGNGLLKKAPAG